MTSLQRRTSHAVVTMVLLYNVGAKVFAAMAKIPMFLEHLFFFRSAKKVLLRHLRDTRNVQSSLKNMRMGFGRCYCQTWCTCLMLKLQQL